MEMYHFLPTIIRPEPAVPAVRPMQCSIMNVA
jgi:hypothetical protein